MRIAITVLPRHWSLSKDVARGVRQGRECGNGFPRLCSGVKLLAYGVMSNHFHVFVYIGHPERIDDAEIVRRIAALYSDARFDQEDGAAMRSNANCGNLLWQSSLTLRLPGARLRRAFGTNRRS